MHDVPISQGNGGQRTCKLFKSGIRIKWLTLRVENKFRAYFASKTNQRHYRFFFRDR